LHKLYKHTLIQMYPKKFYMKRVLGLASKKEMDRYSV